MLLCVHLYDKKLDIHPSLYFKINIFTSCHIKIHECEEIHITIFDVNNRRIENIRTSSNQLIYYQPLSNNDSLILLTL